MTSFAPLAYVDPDSYVTLHYRIELLTGPAAGSIFVDTFLDRPATLQMGVGQWAPGLEELLLGKAEDSHFTVDVPAADAYGERNSELLRWVSHEEMVANAPPGNEFAPGDMVEFVAPNGGRYSGILKEIKNGAALFDFNHPLAGADLQVEIKILGVL